jgi:hypothetical protein
MSFRFDIAKLSSRLAVFGVGVLSAVCLMASFAFAGNQKQCRNHKMLLKNSESENAIRWFHSPGRDWIREAPVVRR